MKALNIFYPEIFCNDVFYSTDFTLTAWVTLQDTFLARYNNDIDCVSDCSPLPVNKTIVIICDFHGETVALFPQESNNGFHTCYTPYGQHGDCNLD